MWIFVFFFSSIIGTSVGTSVVWAGPTSDPELREDQKQVLPAQSDYDAYRGQNVLALRIHGLKRTQETSVRWLLGAIEEQPFDPVAWVDGIGRLYATQVLYNVRTVIGQHTGGIELDIFVEDRWTLVPNIVVQQGGGSTLWALGLIDSNLLGVFNQTQFSVGMFNGSFLFDFESIQEWVGRSPLMMGLSFNRWIYPMTLSAAHPVGLGGMTWSRWQVQAQFGLRPVARVRAFSWLGLVLDSVDSASLASAEARVWDGLVLKIVPTLILGRVFFTDFLESGFEWTSLGSFWVPLKNTRTLLPEFQTKIKAVTTLLRNWNLAYFLQFAIQGLTYLPYQRNLGGFDTVRGFSSFRASGWLVTSTNLELRPYICKFKLPIAREVFLQGAVFADAGWVLPNSGAPVALLSSGAGLRLNFVHFANALIRLDFAKTIYPDNDWDLSFSLGQFF